MKRLDVLDEPGGLSFEFEADGFLYKMVRNIVGHLVDVAVGKASTDEIQKIFDAKDRKKAGRAAPPQGLFLVRVDY
jgi:tRNA pseudouridine38-40 synthase